MADVLHALDQGATSHIIGNIWWELKGVWGSTNQEDQINDLAPMGYESMALSSGGFARINIPTMPNIRHNI